MKLLLFIYAFCFLFCFISYFIACHETINMIAKKKKISRKVPFFEILSCSLSFKIFIVSVIPVINLFFGMTFLFSQELRKNVVNKFGNKDRDEIRNEENDETYEEV